MRILKAASTTLLKPAANQAFANSAEPIPSQEREYGVVGREGFELSTYGLRVQLTPILMRRKPKIPKQFSAGSPASRPKPNLSRTPFR